jgi:sugar lactone lactonase YvrE
MTLRKKRQAEARRSIVITAFAVLLAFAVGAQESVKTVAGSVQTPGATDGSGAAALFSDPTGLCVAADGTVYLADNQNNTIRRIGTNGIVSTFAGQSGIAGTSDGNSTRAQFDSPSGIAVARDGSFFVSDTGNHTIRHISVLGAVTTVAGGAGVADYADGPGATARFNSPLGIAVAPDGRLFVADSGNHLIRVIDGGGSVSTLAGLAETWGNSDGIGTAAQFNNPVGVALDSHGNLFVADANNFIIRMIATNGIVSTFAGRAGVDGTADGLGAAARFGKPAELAIDQRDNLYVADSLYHTIRKITPAGLVATVAGSVGQPGAADGDNGAASFFNPYGIAVSADGLIWIADTYNETVRQLLAPFTTAVSPDRSQVVIAWESVVGQTYQVQFCDGADHPSWQNLNGKVSATNLTTTVTDSSSSPAGHRFYRVLREGN